MSEAEKIKADLIAAGHKIDDDKAAMSQVLASGANHRGQARFAYILAETRRGQLLHAPGLGWLTWDGRRWAIDNGEVAATRHALAVLREAWRAAFNDPALGKEITSCQSANAVRGILSLAAKLDPLAVRVEDLDADPFLLNVANGTLDLRDLSLRPHDPADRLTKITTAAHDTAARSVLWEAFLARVLPDADVRDYMARVAGVSLLGVVREHVLPIASGPGRNGKGTFLETVTTALGDYAHTAPADLLMDSRPGRGRATPELAALRGVRFVQAEETEQGRRLDVSGVKTMTGGDRITARPLYGAPFTFVPSHSIILATNHRPEVPGDDEALWARLSIVPFEVVIPEDERRTTLKEELALQVDAVLAWAVSGWRDYRARGERLDPPPAVRAATSGYRADSDAVARWIEEECLTSPGNTHWKAKAADLFGAWARWARSQGEEAGTQTSFGRDLSRRGFPAVVAGGGVRYRIGLMLQGEESGDPRVPD